MIHNLDTSMKRTKERVTMESSPAPPRYSPHQRKRLQPRAHALYMLNYHSSQPLCWIESPNFFLIIAWREPRYSCWHSQIDVYLAREFSEKPWINAILSVSKWHSLHLINIVFWYVIRLFDAQLGSIEMKSECDKSFTTWHILAFSVG